MPPGSVVVALHVLGDGALLLETEDGLYVARRPYADVTTVQQFPPESYLETEIAVDDGWAWSARRGMSRDHTVLIARPIP
ncbi:MAG: hypothetical protein GTN78_15525 [Gemmatimonadales bacterium]|nr:hypothetical protein [Gemmatimonadales bacterium]